MISVLVADDHPVMCAGLARVLEAEPDMAVVGSARDGREAIALDAELQPDVVLMDLSMPVVSGVDAIRQIVRARPSAAVVVLSASGDSADAFDAFDAGAVGYVLKDSEARAIVEAVRAAARGESPLDPRVSGVLLRERQAQRGTVKLSDREIQVLQLAADGLLNKQIARTLGIGEKTVKAHLGHVYERIGVRSRAEAVAWGAARGIVTTGPAPLDGAGAAGPDAAPGRMPVEGSGTALEGPGTSYDHLDTASPE